MLRKYAGKFAAKNRQNLICESPCQLRWFFCLALRVVCPKTHMVSPGKMIRSGLGHLPGRVVSGWRNWKWQFDPLYQGQWDTVKHLRIYTDYTWHEPCKTNAHFRHCRMVDPKPFQFQKERYSGNPHEIANIFKFQHLTMFHGAGLFLAWYRCAPGTYSLLVLQRLDIAGVGMFTTWLWVLLRFSKHL